MTRTQYITVDTCTQMWPDAPYGRIRENGVTAYNITTCNPDDDLPTALYKFAQWKERFRTFPGDLVEIRTAADIRMAAAEGKAGIIFGVQGLDFIGSHLWLLDLLQELGLRICQLTYNDRNLLGDGCLERTDAGLSHLGVAAVKALNRLNTVVDLTHVGERTSLEAIALSTAPTIFSHSNPRGVMDHPRNITDAQIKACAAGGGVIGVVPWGPLCWRRKESKRPVLDDFLASLQYVVDLVGIDHVGVGTDLSCGTYDAHEGARLVSAYPSLFAEYGEMVEADITSPRRYVEEFDKHADLPALAEKLAARGYADEAIAKVLGGNYLRVFEQVWGA